MSVQLKTPIIGFVWGSGDMRRSVVEVASKTVTRAIFDLTDAELAPRASNIQAAGAKDIKVSPTAFLDPSLEGFLEEAHAIKAMSSMGYIVQVISFLIGRSC